MDRRCLAVVRTARLFRLHLRGSLFPIYYQRDAHLWITSLTDSTGNPARWRLRLSELKYNVVHNAAMKDQAADALSLLKTAEPIRSRRRTKY